MTAPTGSIPVLIRLQSREAGEIWPHVKDGIKEAVRRGGLGSFGYVERCVLSGQMDLWVAADDKIRACAVTDIVQTEWEKFCQIWCSGQGAKDWIGLLRGIEDWAREQGCSRMIVGGRKGWKRLLKDYREMRVILGKEL